MTEIENEPVVAVLNKILEAGSTTTSPQRGMGPADEAQRMSGQ